MGPVREICCALYDPPYMGISISVALGPRTTAKLVSAQILGRFRDTTTMGRERPAQSADVTDECRTGPQRTDPTETAGAGTASKR